MSDDEDIQYVKRKKVVHFGALDEGGVPVRGEISADHMQVRRWSILGLWSSEACNVQDMGVYVCCLANLSCLGNNTCKL